MKTLVIISHPDILESGSQQFLLNAVPKEGVTVHHLETAYPDGKINVEKEHQLLETHDRIIFQFPFYWYSSPAFLKQWQDEVLVEGFAHGKAGGRLVGKEFGLIFMLGVHEREYQAGGRELFTISELTRPFQAVAHKTGMIYLRPLTVYQFAYMNDEEKMDLYIQYQQKLTNKNDSSLAAREDWMVEQINKLDTKDLEPEAADILKHAAELMTTNRTTIDELQVVMDQMW
ncbi:NAD(P)H-dependent oxidoreductase [Lentibacillus saliphilus]|uniref:NAD(P)H-dependent oxidoreductase n=1 Tax=Lentibacillus saliphilus TaxID=2737028 RepID=UPI001C30DF2D|nr:NAD(P)H-dependent oxidoreductase [Lentibacillus saliphilus]